MKTNVGLESLHRRAALTSCCCSKRRRSYLSVTGVPLACWNGTCPTVHIWRFRHGEWGASVNSLRLVSLVLHVELAKVFIGVTVDVHVSLAALLFVPYHYVLLFFHRHVNAVGV